MKISVSTRILPDWHSELQEIITATGQTQSEVMEEAIGLYLKKARRLKVASRLDAVEKRLNTIAALVTQ
jgi:predicted transcriptional regulator